MSLGAQPPPAAGLSAPDPAPGRLGAPRVHFRAVDSTNLVARRLVTAGAPHGTLVTAAEQTAGRGRQGRAWAAPADSSVLMSVILRGRLGLLSLAAGVAVADTALACGAGDVAIKWPNDVWVGGLKVAGILVEGRPQEAWAVLGIGLNVATAPEEFPPELRGRATSLGLERGPGVLEEVLSVLVARLGVWTAAPDADVLAALAARDALLGRTISWADGSARGTAAGIDGAGKLLVDTAAGRVALDAGEVHLSLD